MSADSDLEPDSDRRDRNRTAIAAWGWVVVVLAAVAGPLGAAAGLAATGARYALGTPYAIAVGTVVLAASPGTEPDAITAGGVAVAFLAPVLAPAVRSDRPVAEAAAAVASTAALTGTAWYLARSQPLWIAAGALLRCLALAVYALHRYELVRLGLVPDVQGSGIGDQSAETGAETETEP